MLWVEVSCHISLAIQKLHHSKSSMQSHDEILFMFPAITIHVYFKWDALPVNHLQSASDSPHNMWWTCAICLFLCYTAFPQTAKDQNNVQGFMTSIRSDMINITTSINKCVCESKGAFTPASWGHFITEHMKDDEDIERQRRMMYMQANIL